MTKIRYSTHFLFTQKIESQRLIKKARKMNCKFLIGEPLSVEEQRGYVRLFSRYLLLKGKTKKVFTSRESGELKHYILFGRSPFLKAILDEAFVEYHKSEIL